MEIVLNCNKRNYIWFKNWLVLYVGSREELVSRGYGLVDIGVEGALERCGIYRRIRGGYLLC